MTQQRIGTGFGLPNTTVKKSGEMCKLCENYVVKLLNGCEVDGCHRFKTTPIRLDKGRYHYRMHCPKCDEWMSVGAERGFMCSTCGLECGYASAVNQKMVSREGHESLGRGIEGPITNYEVDDREKDEED